MLQIATECTLPTMPQPCLLVVHLTALYRGKSHGKKKGLAARASKSAFINATKIKKKLLIKNVSLGR